MCEKAQGYPPVEYPGVEKAPSGRISPERFRSIPTHPGKVAGIGSEHRPNSPRNGGRIHVGTVAGLVSEWWPDCVGICKDPQDDHVLELAVESSAKFIVTYNRRDFMGVEKFGIKAVTPNEFLEEIGEKS